jgi:hypothetical protein
MDFQELKEYMHLENISGIEKFLLYMLDKVSSFKPTQTDKRNLAIVYHRLWWFRNNEIKKYFSGSKSFKEYNPFIFEEYKLSAEQDIKSLEFSRKGLSEEKWLSDLLKVFKKDISETISFFSTKEKKEVNLENTSVLYIDNNGNFWHGDKTKFCYPMGVKGKRFMILSYLAENRGIQLTKNISDFVGHNKTQNTRNEIGKIENNIQKFLGLGDVIVSKKDSGYGINSKYKIVKEK